LFKRHKIFISGKDSDTTILITMCYEDGGFYSTAVWTLYYRPDLICPMDVFKGGPGRAVGQQGSREAGTGGRALPWHDGQGAGLGQ
jgi:hypothetical protein